MEESAKDGGVSLIIRQRNVLTSEAKQRAFKKTDRKKLILGRIVHRLPNGEWRSGRIVYHIPSPFASQVESIYIKGPSGSGKSWQAYSIAGQSFFAENRTWVIFDTKGSYIGNNRPNYAFTKEIRDMGGFPRGIPHTQMDVISPLYYTVQLDPDEIKRRWITENYKIPLRFCTLPVMFEITNLNKKTAYATSFDQRFKKILMETHGNPKLTDVQEMIEEIIEDPDMSRTRWTYVMMKKKIEEVADLTISDDSRWSSVGKKLEKAAREGKARWIVFTLSTGQDISNDLNLAIISTVLKEIKAFAEHYLYNREDYSDFRLGVLIDELHTYVRNKDSSSRMAIHDLLHAWGRSNQVMRIFLTQKDEQLDKVFQDDISNGIKSTGTYQCVIGCSAIPEPGYITYVNRVNSNPKEPDKPLYYPKVKACPPLFEVESSETDNQKWKRKMIEELEERKRLEGI